MIKTVDLEAISIIEDGLRHYGADQYWFKNKLHGMSGCGPTTAALITMYMAVTFQQCAALYPYGQPVKKDEFIHHMTEVREYVKPGAMGLTDPTFFAQSTVEFAKNKGVELRFEILSRSISHIEAFNRIKEAVDNRLLPALLILRNPVKELDDFTWHWMAVTGYDDGKESIFVSTYSKEYELRFESVWIQYKPYEADIVIFYPQ
jgi:hypothetical protein